MVRSKQAYETALQQGYTYAWDEDWERAAEEYRRAAEEFPEDPLPHSLLGLALQEASRLEEALSAYLQARELAPQDSAARKRIVEIYLRLERVKEAQEALMTLAQLYEVQGAEEELLKTLQDAVRLDPQNVSPQERLAQAYLEQGDPQSAAARFVALAQSLLPLGDPGPVLNSVRKALQLDRDNAEARGLLFDLLQDPAFLVQTVPDTLYPPGPATQGMTQVRSRLLELLRREESSWGASSADSLEEVLAILQVIDLERRGMWSEALAEYEGIPEIRLAPREINLMRGFLSARIGECDEAQTLLDQVADADDSPAIQHALGECYLTHAGPQEALPYLMECLRLLDLSYALPGQIPSLQHAYTRIQKAYQEKEGRDARRMAFLLAGLLGNEEWQERIKEMRESLDDLATTGLAIPIYEVLELPQPEEFLVSLQRIREAVRQGQHFTALEETYRALEMWNDYIPLHILLAEVLAGEGRGQEAADKYMHVAAVYQIRGEAYLAQRALERAMVLAPQEMRIRRKFLDFLVEQGKVEEALEGYLGMGRTYEELQRSDDALRAYREGLELVGRSSDALRWRVRILEHLAGLQNKLGAVREALDLYEEMKSLDPQNYSVRRILITLHLHLESLDAALQELDDLLAVYKEQEEGGKAVEALQDFLSNGRLPFPFLLEVQERLARTYEELGMKTQTIAVLNFLCGMLLGAGRRREAQEAVRRIIALEPENMEEYQALLARLSSEE